MTASSLRILALAPNSWSGPWMNRQQLLSRLARRHAVLYSQGAWSVWQRDQIEWKRAPWLGTFDHHVSVIVDVPPKIIQRWPRVPAVDRTAIRLTLTRWRQRLKRMGNGPLVVYVFHPMFWPYVELLRPPCLVFHAYDLFSRTPGWTPELGMWQSKLVAEANLVLGSSETIVRHLRSLVRRPVVFLPNGADYELFSGLDREAKQPADLAPIPRPRIGYIGRINMKVDLPLIAQLAAMHTDWHFVMVGEVSNLDSVTANAYKRCIELTNVYFLGPKPHFELSPYIGHCDVNIMAYRLVDSLWTQGIYPLKLHEYLASGRPVVSADMRSVRPFSGVVAIASGTAQWEAALSSAIAGDGVGSMRERRAVARENDWNERAQTLETLLLDLASNSA